MKKIISFILSFFRFGVIQPSVSGLVPDNIADYGFFGFRANANAYATRAIAAITTAGTASVMTAAQAIASVVRLDSGASGGFTLTLPTTAAIFAALPSTVPTDGTFSKIVQIVNNAVGQTGTLTAGDASTTITGTATIATSVTREYLLTVTSATTLTYENIGSKTL